MRDNNKILEHQLEEWKILNEYINKMDTGYQQSFVVMISVFAGITTLVSSDIGPVNIQRAIFIVPMGIITVFAYLSYQFRITAILRGHLAALEEKMNKALEENVHMWNSSLVETFMAHNNSINNKMMLPMLSFAVMLIIYCGYITWEILKTVSYGKLIFFIYWFIVLTGAVIVLIPFLENEKVRYETANENRVMKMYQKYRDGYEDNRQREKFRYEEWDEKVRKENHYILYKSILAGAANAIFGVGVLSIFWYFADKGTGLKGFIDYYAATIGDGIFLSVLIGAGYFFVSKNQGWRKVQVYPENAYFRIWILNIVAVLTGIGIQISWLVSSQTELNWSINRVHHFAPSGWYHALYFIVMFGVISRIFVTAVYTNRYFADSVKNSYLIMWISGLGYWYTHLIDDYLTTENYIVWMMVSTIVAVVLYILCEKNRIQNLKNILLVLIGSVFLAVFIHIFCQAGGLEWNVIEALDHLNDFLRGR